MRVNLQIFKLNGKWYTDGHYDTDKVQLYEIWDEVRGMIADGRLPGLREGHDSNSWMVHVDVPEHPYRHPHIVRPIDV